MLRRMNLSSFLMVSPEFFTGNYFVVLAVILLILDGFNQHYEAFVHFILSRVLINLNNIKIINLGNVENRTWEAWVRSKIPTSVLYHHP